MERLHGRSLMEMGTSETTDPDNHMRRMLVAAELQARINQFSCPDLPSLQETLRTRISSAALSQREKDDVLDVLERCPQGDTVFHGDFHPGNLMKTDRGIYAIDWFNAHHAHPAADIARTSLLLRTAMLPDTLSVKVRTLIEKARTAESRATLLAPDRAVPAFGNRFTSTSAKTKNSSACRSKADYVRTRLKMSPSLW